MLDQHPMKNFFNSRTQHATTALVLMAWLFALASGIANACLLADHRGSQSHSHSSAAAIAESPHAHAVTVLAERGTTVDSDSEQSRAAKAGCLDACDDRAHSLPKQETSLIQPLLAPLTLFASVWLASQPIASVLRLDRDHHADPFGIPIRVRYARLTL